MEDLPGSRAGGGADAMRTCSIEWSTGILVAMPRAQRVAKDYSSWPHGDI